MSLRKRMVCNFLMNFMHTLNLGLSCHRWSPKNWFPGPSVAIFIALDGPRTKYGCHGWSPLAADGSPLENHPSSFMMVLHAAYCKVQSLAVTFQFAGFDYCTPQVASSILFHMHGRLCMCAWISCIMYGYIAIHLLTCNCLYIHACMYMQR